MYRIPKRGCFDFISFNGCVASFIGIVFAFREDFFICRNKYSVFVFLKGNQRVFDNHSVGILARGYLYAKITVRIARYKNIIEMCLFFYVDIDVSVDASVGHVIDYKPEGR